MYAVVKFVVENTVEVVPTNWLLSETLCLWPPQKTADVAKLIKKRMEPQSSWEYCAIKLLSQAGMLL